jgi:hypothetical protein
MIVKSFTFAIISEKVLPEVTENPAGSKGNVNVVHVFTTLTGMPGPLYIYSKSASKIKEHEKPGQIFIS